MMANYWTADKWTLHVLETFLNVLRRPKFGIVVGDIEKGKLFKNSDQETISVNIHGFGEHVILRMNWNKHLVCIYVNESENDKFKFFAKFNRRKMPKIRKTALIFVEKLRNKVVFDTMKM